MHADDDDDDDDGNDDVIRCDVMMTTYSGPEFFSSSHPDNQKRL